MQNNSLFSRLSFIISGISIGALVFYFFTFSTYEEKEALSHQRQFNENYKVYSLNLPQGITFAEESIPLQLIDVSEKLDRELLVNTYWQSNGLLLIKRAHRWFPIIEPILKKNNIPNDFKYLALIESGLTQIVSPAGATGFWQIMKATGKENGLTINKEIDERYNVEKSTEVACKYLNEAYGRFGSWTLAAASYNMGMNGLAKQLNRQKVNNYYDLLLNDETGRYLYRIIALKHIMNQPEKFGFNFRNTDLYPTIPTTEIVLDSGVSNFAWYARELNINYKVLKYFNPWLRQSYLTNAKKDTYLIKIPTFEYQSKLLLELPNFPVSDSVTIDSLVSN
ncbi:MAG: lytic transglycosylase domain-containing protein [Salibacteraceae bacterium]